MRLYFSTSVRRDTSVGCAVSTSSMRSAADRLVQPLGGEAAGNQARTLPRTSRAAAVNPDRGDGPAASGPVVLLGDVGEVEEMREGPRDRQRRVHGHRESSLVNCSNSASSPPRAPVGTSTQRLSPRHAELLYALAVHREGRTASELAEDIFGDATRMVTVRAEISRLRRHLAEVLAHRPYRFGDGRGGGGGPSGAPGRSAAALEGAGGGRARRRRDGRGSAPEPTGGAAGRAVTGAGPPAGP